MTELSKKREMNFRTSREDSLNQVAQAILDGTLHVNQELRGKEGDMLSGAGDLREDRTPGKQVRRAHLWKKRKARSRV